MAAMTQAEYAQHGDRTIAPFLAGKNLVGRKFPFAMKKWKGENGYARACSREREMTKIFVLIGAAVFLLLPTTANAVEGRLVAGNGAKTVWVCA